MSNLGKSVANYRWRSYWLRRTDRVPVGPFYINVEPTNVCNLRCRVCAIDGSRPPGYMDMDLFHKIIDDAKDCGTREVALFLAGESVLHRDLPAMIEYTRLKGLEPRLYTNSTVLTPERSAAILDAGLEFIGFSFDGETKELYESMRVGAKYEEVLQNILTFLEMKKARHLTKPFVSFKILKFLENEQQELSPEFVKIFDGLPVDQFQVGNPHDWRGEKEGVKQADPGSHYYPCLVFWSVMSVGWDGRVLGCSADLNGRIILGDLTKQSIMEVWNGPQFVYHRRMLRAGRYQELELCRKCCFLWNQRDARLSYLASIPPLEPVKNTIKKVLKIKSISRARRIKAKAVD